MRQPFLANGISVTSPPIVQTGAVSTKCSSMGVEALDRPIQAPAVMHQETLISIDDRKKSSQPFFAYIACNAPHVPLQVRHEDEARYAAKVSNTNAARFLGMVANIDDNIGRLLSRLAQLGLERN